VRQVYIGRCKTCAVRPAGRDFAVMVESVVDRVSPVHSCGFLRGRMSSMRAVSWHSSFAAAARARSAYGKRHNAMTRVIDGTGRNTHPLCNVGY
jgi:hypothetical protein